ncbi:hypothetical protein PBI_CHE12_68 [Mycobacterium phage Che12]|uniref:Uncharacterized protein n=1 Tax=Mycobacterium phage Che12 TaxID=2911435 RepID=Q1A0E9_9CAUD|nr:gp68 [Mycobacterium phage Che12]ABE67387.1 hypothetical protein PBI_CHE12_68 [Mycobacterium phage Che12]
MRFLTLLVYGEAAYHLGLILGATTGFYGWHP